jgi:hypothetical protein
MPIPSSPKALFTVSDILTLTGIIVTVIGIIIALLQFGFTPASIVISVIGVTVLIYLLVARILPWFREHFSASIEEVIDTSTIELSIPEPLPPPPPPSLLLQSDQTFLDQVLDKLDTSPPLMLLAQEHRLLPNVMETIYQQLLYRVGEEYTCQLIPTGQEQATEEEYFLNLAKQLGWQRPCKTAFDWENLLMGKLPQDHHSLYLFLNRLEKGNLERAKELAIALRNLVLKGKLKVLLLGSGKLEELKFQADTSSLLNIALIERWPELTSEDVQRLYEQQFPQHPPLTAKDRQDILEASGGHPELLKCCLTYRVKTPAGTVPDYPGLLSQETVLVSAFTKFTHQPTHLQQLGEWLNQTEVGPALPHIFDPLLREVYWLNLLKAQEGRLVWRCEAVRRAGLQMLEELAKVRKK